MRSDRQDRMVFRKTMDNRIIPVVTEGVLAATVYDGCLG